MTEPKASAGTAAARGTSARGSKALIVAPAWVGDMVMAHSLIRVLADRHATLNRPLELHVVAPKATAALGERMAEVSQVFTADFAHGELGWSTRRALGTKLRAQGYDVAYVLPNTWKSALVPWFARIPRRVGFHGEARFALLNDRRRLDEALYPLMIERFMALGDATGALPAEPYPLPRLTVDEVNRADALARLELAPGDVTALCPGAEFGAAKKWPHYAELARERLQSGQQVWLLGSPGDREDCDKIADAASGARNLAGETSLLDAIDLLSVADTVVCNDSGLMHIACALGRPTVGVFGSTSPGFTPPLGEHATVAEIELDCRPCFQRTCPLGHLDCLNKLTPADVIARIPARA